VACIEEKRNPYRIVVKFEGKRPLGRLRRRCEGNISMIVFKKYGGKSCSRFI
jgi:hypothetical protein